MKRKVEQKQQRCKGKTEHFAYENFQKFLNKPKDTIINKIYKTKQKVFFLYITTYDPSEKQQKNRKNKNLGPKQHVFQYQLQGHLTVPMEKVRAKKIMNKFYFDRKIHRTKSQRQK